MPKGNSTSVKPFIIQHISSLVFKISDSELTETQLLPDPRQPRQRPAGSLGTVPDLVGLHPGPVRPDPVASAPDFAARCRLVVQLYLHCEHDPEAVLLLAEGPDHWRPVPLQRPRQRVSSGAVVHGKSLQATFLWYLALDVTAYYVFEFHSTRLVRSVYCSQTKQ